MSSALPSRGRPKPALIFTPGRNWLWHPPKLIPIWSRYLLLYALQFGRIKHTSLATGQRLFQSLLEIPEKMNEILKQDKNIKEIADKV